MNPAIVITTDFNGLSIIQDLGRKRVTSFALDHKRSIGSYSRYSRFIRCPNALYQEEDFLLNLERFILTFDVSPTVFCTDDTTVFSVSKIKEHLQGAANFCLADHELVDLLLDKSKFYRLGQRKNWGTPKTWDLTHLHEIRDFEFPIVAKAKGKEYSKGIDAAKLNTNLVRLRLEVISSREHLAAFLEREKSWLNYLVFQQFIPGLSDQMYTIGIYADRYSQIRGVFSGRKIRGFPATMGDCKVGVNWDPPPGLLERVAKIVFDLRLTGIAEFEFKYDSVTDFFVLIEINPRSWSWIGITSNCGVNLPWLAYQDLNGMSIPSEVIRSSDSQSQSIRYMKVLEDVTNCSYKYVSDHPSWRIGVYRWAREFRNYDRTVMAEFQIDEPLVALVSILQWFFKLIYALPALAWLRPLWRMASRNASYPERN